MQDNAIIAGLDVDKTVTDFLAPEVGPADKSTFLKLSTILGLGAGVAAAVPGLDAVGAGLAIIGAIFGVSGLIRSQCLNKTPASTFADCA